MGWSGNSRLLARLAPRLALAGLACPALPPARRRIAARARLFAAGGAPSRPLLAAGAGTQGLEQFAARRRLRLLGRLDGTAGDLRLDELGQRLVVAVVEFFRVEAAFLALDDMRRERDHLGLGAHRWQLLEDVLGRSHL